jgi:formylglycine-generating enzyme required for sulfatase activity
MNTNRDMQRRTFLQVSAGLTAGCLGHSLLPAQESAPKKLAFLVGVSKYQKDGFDDLNYCERDVEALATVLKAQQFQVVALMGKAATTDAIRKQLTTFFSDLSQLSKQDVVLLGFSGHGVQSLVPSPTKGEEEIEDAFFCPFDAARSRPESMISISWVMSQINEHSGSSQNLLLIDACRNNPNKGGKNIDGSTAKQLPNKISVLFSSSAGAKSYESDKIQHGLFTHVLLDGLSGKAANQNGQITWLNLASYAIDEVPKKSKELLDVEQQPNLLGNLVRQPVLAKVTASKPMPIIEPALLKAPFGESEARAAQRAWASYLKREVLLTNKLGMKLSLIPPGEFEMGSPGSEADRSTDEHLHRVRISRPYYLGVYEVTQEEWESVMGSNPSWFSRSGDGKNDVSGLDTSRFPVESISWEEASEFCRKLSAREGELYRLPTEAEWEYACRGGVKSAYYFGDDRSQLQTYAWFANNSGRSTLDSDKLWETYRTTPQKYLEALLANQCHPHLVGAKKPNPFGLYDMHGNVWEWCRDYYAKDYYQSAPSTDPENTTPDKDSYRVCRGGSWFSNARDSRSAYRSWSTATNRGSNIGFRVCHPLR